MGFNALKTKIDYLRKFATIMSGYQTLGNAYFVFSTSDAWYDEFQKMCDVNYEDGTYPFHTTLASAIAACTTNRNDVIFLDANTKHTLTAGLAITLNRTHFIGMDGGNRLQQQGARIWLTTAATTAYVMKNTGVRNSFENIKFIQASTQGTALNVVQEGGEGTLYKNCSFVFEVADNLGGTTAQEFLAGSDSGTYLDCTFGNDTLVTSAARTVFYIKTVTTSQPFKSNILRRCNFIIGSSSADAKFVSAYSIADINFTNLFDDCTFQASICGSAGTVELTRGVTTPNGLTAGSLNFAYPRAFGVADFGTNGTNNDQLQVLGPLAVATGLVGIAPTA